MKQTKTTLKELTAMYRAVLRHGILCNAIALGLIATATPAMAETTLPLNVNAADTLTISDETFAGISDKASNGWGVIENAGNLTLDHVSLGTEESGNTGSWGVIDTWGNLTVKDSTVQNNTATNWGGSIYNEGNTTVSNSKFKNNFVQNSGGAIATNTDTTSMLTVKENSSFVGNHAFGDGGAIANFSGLNISKTKFEDNTAQLKKDENGNYTIARTDDDTPMGGGAIALGAISATNIGSITDTVFESNKSGTNGGAIATRKASDADNSAAKLDIAATFTGNEALENGGAIYNSFYADNGLDKGDGVTVTGTFESNKAKSGGAIYNDGTVDKAGNAGGVMTLTDSTFTGNSAKSGGAVHNEGTMTLTNVTFGGETADLGNKTTGGLGGAINNIGSLTINGASSFNNNAANGSGGAIANTGNLTIAGTAENKVIFENSITTKGTTYGGAIFNNNGVLNIKNASFTNNALYGGKDGGAIRTSGTQKSVISDTTFTGNYTNDNYTTISGNGGAIWNSGVLSLTNNTFSGNGLKDGNIKVTSGGAIYNNGASANMEITGGSFVKNSAQNGGAIYNTGALTVKDVVIGGSAENKNTSNLNDSTSGGGIYNTGTLTIDGGELSYNESTLSGGGIYNNKTLNISNALLANNKSSQGGAVFNTGASGVVNISNATFTGNGATTNGGAVFNGGTAGTTANITDSSFANNTATGDGGAVYNTGKLSLNGANTFSGNMVWDENDEKFVKKDIYNSGTLNINGTAKMDGGINGGGTITLGANSVLDLIGNETDGTSGVGAGTLNVTNGAKIALDWGDKIKVLNAINGDLNVSSIYIDKTKLSDGETVELFNGAQVGTLSGLENLEFFDTNNKYTVSQNGKNLQLTGSVGGGLSGAVDSTSGKDFVSYTLTDNDETVLTNKTIASTMNIVGDGTETESKSVTLGADLTVADGATAEINDLKLAGTGALNNAATGVLKIKDSNIGVRVRNAGILYSDPTTYSDTLTNTGVANIAGDTFAATSVLENYNVANLTNAIFENGAKITGTGTTNLVSGTTVFNNTANTNTVKVASGADFTGALVGGTLDTHNGAIDTIAGSFSGGNVVLDAKLGSTKKIDTVAGGTIKEINILGTEYGTDDSISLAIGDATLDDNLQINGMNYYTKVEKDGTNLKFSDKLVNASGMKANAENADFTGTKVNGSTAATLKDALSATNAQVNTNTTAIAGKQDAITESNKLATNLVDTSDSAMFVSADEKSTWNAKQNAITSGSKLASNLVEFTDAESKALASGIDSTKVGQIATNTSSIATINSTLDALGTTANTDLADLFDGSTDADIAAWAGTNADKVATVGTTFGVLSQKLTNVQSDLMAAGDNSGSIAHALGGTTASDTLVAQVGNVALNTTYDANATYADNSLGKAIQGKQDAITDTSTIVADGTGLKVADASIGTTQLADSAVTTDKIADNAITSGKIADGTIVNADIADGTITTAKLASQNVSQFTNDAGYQNATQVGDAIDTKIAALDLANTYEAKGAAATAKSEAITAAATDATTKANQALQDAKDYVDGKGYKTESEINALISSATSGKQDAIVDNAFIVTDGAGGLKVADASVTDSHLAANAVTTAKVADGAITTAKVANGAITSDKLDSGVQASLTKANNAVQTVSTGTTDGTITVDGTEVAVAGWNTKQDAISNTSTIVADGTGLKVADGSIGATQLDSSVNASLTKANNSVQSVTTGSSNGTINVDGTDVAVAGLGSLAYEDAASFETAGAAATAEANAKAYTDARLSALHDNSVEMANAYTDKRIESLDKNLSAGVAGAVALSAVATSGVERGEVSVGAGYGYFNGQSAAAFGATMGLTNRWSINAGAGISNADVSFRAGTNYKFKLF